MRKASILSQVTRFNFHILNLTARVYNWLQNIFLCVRGCLHLSLYRNRPTTSLRCLPSEHFHILIPMCTNLRMSQENTGDSRRILRLHISFSPISLVDFIIESITQIFLSYKIEIMCFVDFLNIEAVR